MDLMQKRMFTVHVMWDEEVKVFTASSDDVPGLVAEADTWEKLLSKLQVLVPLLLKENSVDFDSDEIPINLLQSHHLFVNAAA